MDVDLLRPGTVPISPDTIFWFEFLLDESLLLRHLQKPFPDPTATELIIKFTSAIFESIKNDVKRVEVENSEGNRQEIITETQPKHSLKNVALKILALKVLAYLKWDLTQIKNLPFKIQINLLQDLVYFTNDNAIVEIPNLPEYDLAVISNPFLFALLLYHRWVLFTVINRVSSYGQLRISCIPEIYPVDDGIICTVDVINKSISFLLDALNWTTIPCILTYDSFCAPTENSVDLQQKLENSLPIKIEEFHAQIHFDLASYYFYQESYSVAKTHFMVCSEIFKSLPADSNFVNIEFDTLEGYLLACGAPIEGYKISLFQQLQTCIANHYMGILNVLQQDNIYREIPIAYRISLELDIQGALSSGKFTVARDLLPKIQALNVVRCLLDNQPLGQYNLTNEKNFDTLIWAICQTLKSYSKQDLAQIKSFFIELIVSNKSTNFLKKITSHDDLSNLLDKSDVDYINGAVSETISFPKMLLCTDWDQTQFSNKRNLRLSIRVLEQQIISSYNAQELRELLVKLATKNPSKPACQINQRWEVPIPLQSVLMSMPRGFLQDFGFILLAKSRELMISKDWSTSLEFLRLIETEVQSSPSNASPKFSRLLSWEILLVQITQLLEEWPAPHLEKQALVSACEACLQTNESVLPRTEVMEQCALCLLNLGHWDFLASLEKRWSYFEIAAAITAACQDLAKFKGNKKVCKDLWDIVLPVFAAQSSQTKRTSGGSSNVMHRDSPTSNSKAVLMGFLSRLRDSTALTVIISMLARLYNILKDESSLELNTDYIVLWPAVVSNANSYSTRAVCEILSQVVTQALCYYSNNVPWLRLMGDINFVNSHYEAALNFYLKSLLIATDYFNLPVRNDDHVFRRMIKCCSALSCHTQAAVLCQFLEEPDYVLAFRSLSEQKTCSDATDSYYNCFWETSILEYLVHLHHKKGEFQRKKRAVQVMSLLELNSNNNEEIKREASNVRKSTFLRALCKQYVH